MDTNTQYHYGQLRKAGYSAIHALYAARALAEWKQLDGDNVRLVLDAEEESYMDSYGEPEAYTDQHGKRVCAEQARKELIHQLETLGCWRIRSEWRASEEDEWEPADSVGMCAGYENPLDPRENWYVPDLMRSALDAYHNAALAPCL